ncbi:NAD(P)-binding domain-containing protein [Streptomyces sp. RP5T]|uniref:NAD(P)-binding domain-containing protein n=1 Tax=Streptomyces sp. RP5T TaxID=2490848 RepID=UPI0034D975BB
MLDRRGDSLIVLLLSTVSVEAVRRLSELCSAQGVPLLDAGVTGKARAAEHGLVVIVGGPDEAVELAMPALRGFAKAVLRCGGPGTGKVGQLVRKPIMYGQWAVIHEASALLRVGGVTLENLLQIMVEGADEGSEHLFLLRGARWRAASRSGADEFGPLSGAEGCRRGARVGRSHWTAKVADRPRTALHAGGLQGGSGQASVRRRARAGTLMDRIYDDGFRKQMLQGVRIPIDHPHRRSTLRRGLARPPLTLRYRRLFSVGITAMFGRTDLVETQLRARPVSSPSTSSLRSWCTVTTTLAGETAAYCSP